MPSRASAPMLSSAGFCVSALWAIRLPTTTLWPPFGNSSSYEASPEGLSSSWL